MMEEQLGSVLERGPVRLIAGGEMTNEYILVKLCSPGNQGSRKRDAATGPEVTRKIQQTAAGSNLVLRQEAKGHYVDGDHESSEA